MDEGQDRHALMGGHFERNGIYEGYHDLCMKLDTVPVSRDALIDVYLDILEKRDELYEQASSEVENDKRKLLEDLEEEGAPVEELVMVNALPPSMTITVNELKAGIICLYVVFPKGPSKPYVIPAYVESGNDRATFL